MIDQPTFLAAAIPAAVAVGLSKGGLPVVGMLGVPVLALVMSPLEAAGLLLPIYIITDWFGLWFYRKHYSAENLRILVPAGVLGVGIGWALASVVPEDAVALMVGLIGAVFCIWRWFGGGTGQPRPARVGPGTFWGAMAGFTSFVSHSGAPPYQVYILPQRLEKLVYAGTSTILFTVINAVKLVPYWALGQMSWTTVKATAILMPFGALATFAGVRLVKIIPELVFFRIVQAALFLVSVKLIWDSLVHLLH